MSEDETREDERLEIIDELSDLLFVVQEMGRRLANKTHNSLYTRVEELNELLHQARLQLVKIKEAAVKVD